MRNITWICPKCGSPNHDSISESAFSQWVTGAQCSTCDRDFKWSEVYPPDDLIREASHLAYDQDMVQVIGLDSSRQWVIRGYEDPESASLKCAYQVDATGIPV